MNISPLKLTLDTNCVINLFDGNSASATSVEILNELMRLGLSNKIEIKITTRVEADLANDKNATRKEEMLRILNMFPVIGTIARFDVTRLDSGDVLAGDDSDRLETEVQRILFPGLSQQDRRYTNKQNDIDHVVGHLINTRDIFVTDDRDILKRKDELKSSLGAVVMAPVDCLKYVQGVIERSTPRSLDPEEINQKYHSPTFSGTVTFDYSNNNGRFVIGKGHFLFETRWSHASANSIHAYSDAPSVRCLALYKKDMPINKLGDVSILDYSSRARSPEEGQTVIWQNENGIYAATKILDVKYEGRSDEDDRDELTFEYTIQTDGSSAF